jgi:hypothetical protein
MAVHLPLLWLHPTIAQTLAGAGDLEARGLLRGIGRLIVGVVVILLIIGVLLGILLARMFGRGR